MLFCLAHALVLGRIQLFGCATPLLYVYFVVMFPRNYPRWASLLWSFALGLAIDIFQNTPGLSAAALTLTGFVQPYLTELFLPRDAEDDIEVSMKSLGAWNFSALTAFLVLIFCTAYFALEAFSFFDMSLLLQCIGGSTLLTFLLILTLEQLRK